MKIAYFIAAAVVTISIFLFFRISPALKTKPNVLVVVIDTLRADHLGFNGYERNTTPFLDSFAAENLNFKHATSPASWTPPSVASILSGIYPTVHGHMPLRSKTDYGKRFTRLDDSFHTLAEVFSENGYDTAAITANPIVSNKYGFAQGFKLFISGGREDAEKVNLRSKKYLSDLRDKKKPFFLYLQYMDPHDPYEPNPPYDKSFSGAIKSRAYPLPQSDFMNKYDGEIAYTDKKVSELFSWLKGQGLYDDLTILITSDHGEQFMERGYQGHADRTYLEEAHVPLILKTADKKGEENTYVSSVDIYPTVLDAAGLKFTNPIHGYSLLTDLDKRKSEGVMTEIIRHVNEKAYTSQDGIKLIIEQKMEKGMIISPDELINGPEIKSKKVFDLNKDPFEVNPITDKNLQAELEGKFKNLYLKTLSIKNKYTTSDVELDEKSLEELKTLGYF
jgi:arylsulfatase A-like enzyme